MDLPEFKVYKHPNRHCWFIALSVSGTILIDRCTSLESAIQARRRLLAVARGLHKREADVPLNLALGLRRV